MSHNLPIPKTRRGIVSGIKRLTNPRLRKSGYRKISDHSKGISGGTRALMIWTPPSPINIHGFVLDEVLAITEDGIMTDTHGGGCINENFGCFPMEDLQELYKRLHEILND